MDTAPLATVRVVAAVVRRGDEVLICRRPAHKRHGGLWEFPGGKVRAGETFAEALRRELDEELGVRLTGCGSVVFVARDPGSPFRIHFVEVAIEGEPECREHDGIEWVGTDGLDELPLAPADAEFARVYTRT